MKKTLHDRFAYLYLFYIYANGKINFASSYFVFERQYLKNHKSLLLRVFHFKSTTQNWFLFYILLTPIKYYNTVL